MNLKLLAWMALPLVGLVVVGYLAFWLLGALFSALSWVLGLVFYLLLGAAVVGVGLWGWSKVRDRMGGESRHNETR